MKTSYIIPAIKVKRVYPSHMITLSEGANTISSGEITEESGFASKQGTGFSGEDE